MKYYSSPLYEIYNNKMAAKSAYLVLDVLSLDADGLLIVVSDPLVASVSVHHFVFIIVLESGKYTKSS